MILLVVPPWWEGMEGFMKDEAGKRRSQAQKQRPCLKSIGISFMGNYNKISEPSAAMLAAAKNLIDYGVPMVSAMVPPTPSLETQFHTDEGGFFSPVT
ncbi:hypothetical protein CEXT_184681 [Caerostris extrusa]|uniref:Uncharacterized protein n=1 Tax=Caerostris extrusa TaxID=172846 RepID=A0AAV4P3B9_CAEEX|nr:hypothetical protein CEXT_184681 [Caerostris extrusa]